MAVTDQTAPSSDFPASAALAVAERQLVMLRELAEMAMEVSRAFSSSAVASAKAEEAILADEYFVPEVGRARACGAKDAAESFQKVSRAMRLTLMLQTTVAVTVDDLRAGVAARPTAAAPDHGPKAARLVIGETPTPCVDPREADGEGEAARLERPGGERERREIEYADRLPRGAYTCIVDDLAADLGVTIHWPSATVSPRPSPPDRTGAVREDEATREPPGRQERQGHSAERAGVG